MANIEMLLLFSPIGNLTMFSSSMITLVFYELLYKSTNDKLIDWHFIIFKI